MPEIVNRLLDYLHIPTRDIDASAEELIEVRNASVLPSLTLALFAIATFVEFTHENAPIRVDTWGRLYSVSDSLYKLGLYVTLAGAFFMGIRGISRVAGAWCAYIGLTFVGLAIALGFFVAALFAFTDLNDSLYDDWHVNTWRNLSYLLGFLALGYAFLAYRGLSMDAEPDTDD